MSTAQHRAAAHIAAVLAEGHSITLVSNGFSDGRDAIVTAFGVGPTRELDPATAALAQSYRRDRGPDDSALVAELIRRGMVE